MYYSTEASTHKARKLIADMTSNDHQFSYGQPVVAQVGQDTQHLNTYMPDSACLLFEFILNFLITGLLCVAGFTGNTICFVTLWQQHHHTAMTFLLQAVIIADLAVIWVIFVEKVIPGLGYVIPLLSNCHSVCYKITSVTRPLLTLAESCVIWLTLCAAINRYMVMNKPSKSSLVGTLEFARKQVILVLACSVILILPLTFESSIKVAHIHLDTKVIHTESLRDNSLYKRIYLFGVLNVLVLLIPWICVVYIGTRLGIILHSVKRLHRALSNMNRAQNTEMTQVMLTLCITLSVCYMPSVIQGIVYWAHPDQPASCGHLHYYLDNFCKMFKVLNSCLMLLILCLFQPKFPELLKETFCSDQMCCWCCRDTYKGKSDRNNGFRGYRCEDMSEMTLMSQMDDHVENNRI